ncbi:MAG: acetamidase/formamidase family protein [Bacteroidetes bacterium]|nr:acetamidase/formamidase family protein [Bacteroidota bacterium]
MIKIKRDQITFNFSKNNTPIAFVEPNTELLFETRDGADGQILTGEEDLNQLDISRSNPVTGPVFIVGAEQGDTIIVEILNIELAPSGFLAVIAGRGVLKMDTLIKIIEVKNGKIIFSPSLQIPITPMIGTIGTAPADEECGAAFVGNYGGNMDNIDATVGSKIYLPVFVKGGLLSIGDLHANQGDGELMGSSLEIEGRVTLRIHLLKDKCWKRPWIETPTAWITCAHADTLPKAILYATDDMVNLLCEKIGIGKQEAYMLISLTGGVRLCQSCEWIVSPTVRAVFPKLEM